MVQFTGVTVLLIASLVYFTHGGGISLPCYSCFFIRDNFHQSTLTILNSSSMFSSKTGMNFQNTTETSVCISNNIDQTNVEVRRGEACYYGVFFDAYGKSEAAWRGAFSSFEDFVDRIDIWDKDAHFKFRKCMSSFCNDVNNDATAASLSFTLLIISLILVKSVL